MYYYFGDFFDVQFVMDSFYVIFGFSFFWIVGMPVQVLVATILQVYILVETFIQYEKA